MYIFFDFFFNCTTYFFFPVCYFLIYLFIIFLHSHGYDGTVADYIEGLLGVGAGGLVEHVSSWSEFQIRSFRVLRRRPCLCQYYTHFYVVCGHVAWKRGCVACRNFTLPWPHYSKINHAINP